MQIDNTRAGMFRLCPWFYYEAFLRNGTGVVPAPKKGDGGYTALEFGGRVHETLEVYYKTLQAIQEGNVLYSEDPYKVGNERLEEEATWVMQSYQAHYPHDNWDIIDVERTFKVQLPLRCPDCVSTEVVPYPGDVQWHCNECGNRFNKEPHVYVGKIDLFIRDRDTGRYYILDHKTEARGSRSHTPSKLAVTDQGSLYLWAARKLYPQVDGMLYNILVRPSPAGREGPSFKERYLIERSEHEIAIAVRDITIVADDIEAYAARFGDGEWPANRANCEGWGLCDYYQLHRFGEDPQLALKHKFAPREEYLQLGGIEVVQ